VRSRTLSLEAVLRDVIQVYGQSNTVGAEAGEGRAAVADLCQECETSTATLSRWRSKYGGMGVSVMTRIKEFEEENRIPRLLAQITID
jgi:hypothetical protein